MNLSPKTLERLRDIIKRAEQKEAASQLLFGPRHRGTLRYDEWLDAQALREVLAYLDKESK